MSLLNGQCESENLRCPYITAHGNSNSDCHGFRRLSFFIFKALPRFFLFLKIKTLQLSQYKIITNKRLFTILE